MRCPNCKSKEIMDVHNQAEGNEQLEIKACYECSCYFPIFILPEVNYERNWQDERC